VKTAIITGVNGQDGSYMAELLLGKGYQVIGTIRSKNPRWPVFFTPQQDNLKLVHVDLSHPESYINLIRSSAPVDEFYNFAAQSHVGMSFEFPKETRIVNAVAADGLMDVFFWHNHNGKFYQASTSEMFGDGLVAPADHNTPFAPCSPYADAKLLAHRYACEHQRHGRLCFSGVLFNHESSRRHESFVTQKVCIAAVQAYRFSKLSKCYQTPKPLLSLGSGSSRRDWGFAPEYVEAIYNWVQLAGWSAESVVLGTGESHSVFELVEKAYSRFSIDWRDFVTFDNSELLRPNEVNYLQADPTDLNNLLGRESMKFAEIIDIMIESLLIAS
jgi:GDPmannose 4,6-dehydratase